MIPYYKPYIGKEEKAAVQRVLDSGWLTEGPEVQAFQEEFAEIEGCKYCLAVSSATMGIWIAFNALYKKHFIRQTVIPSYTYIGSVPCGWSISQFMDVNNNYIIKDVIDGALNILVHFAGQRGRCHDIDYVIEDCAHRLPGHKYNHGDIWVYSFYANKCMTTGDGGMICTNNKILYDEMKLFYYSGIKRKQKRYDYDIISKGIKANMTDIQAAIGREQLKKISEIHERRQGVANRYIKAFDNYNIWTLPFTFNNFWHLFPIRYKNRTKIETALSEANIGFSRHFKPLDRMTLFKNCQPKTENAWRLWKQTISLPIYPDLTVKQQNEIIDTILEVVV